MDTAMRPKTARPATTARSASRRRPRSGRSSWRSAAGTDRRRAGAESVDAFRRRGECLSRPLRPRLPRASRPSAGARAAPRVGGGARSRRPGLHPPRAAGTRAGARRAGAAASRSRCFPRPGGPARQKLSRSCARENRRLPSRCGPPREVCAFAPTAGSRVFLQPCRGLRGGRPARQGVRVSRARLARARRLPVRAAAAGVTTVTAPRGMRVLPYRGMIEGGRAAARMAPAHGSAAEGGGRIDAGLRDSFKGCR